MVGGGAWVTLGAACDEALRQGVFTLVTLGRFFDVGVKI